MFFLKKSDIFLGKQDDYYRNISKYVVVCDSKDQKPPKSIHNRTRYYLRKGCSYEMSI